MTDHYELSCENVEIAEDNRAELIDLYAIPPDARDARQVAKLNHELGDALKLAEIHATLAVAQALHQIHALLDAKA